jgi:hypothetical protein
MKFSGSGAETDHCCISSRGLNEIKNEALGLNYNVLRNFFEYYLLYISCMWVLTAFFRGNLPVYFLGMVAPEPLFHFL